MTARTKAQRIPILISPLWRLLLRLVGVTPETSYVEVRDGKVRVRFGRPVDLRFPLEQVETASPSHWPLWAGIGPRFFRGTVGLIGTYVNVVEMRLREPQPVKIYGLTVSCHRLFVSVEEPSELTELVRPPTTAKAA